MPFKSAEQMTKRYKEIKNACAGVQGEAARRHGIDMCSYEGAQWLDSESRTLTRLERLKRELNPDSNRVRVILNQIARLVQKEAASTYTDRVDLYCNPPVRDLGARPSVIAQLCEDLVNMLVDATRFRRAKIEANFQRSLVGTGGVMASLRSVVRNMTYEGEPQSLPDVELSCKPFSTLKLGLDPECMDKDLDEHPYVLYSDAWTASKIREVLGGMLAAAKIQLDESRMQTIGSLCPFEKGISDLSQSRLFAHYRTFAETKGAIVNQYHERDPATGRYPTMYVSITLPDHGEIPLNIDSPQTPFGGSGMPFMVYHAHSRADSFWSFGAAAMLKDYQDILNYFMTTILRQASKSSGANWLVDMNGQNGAKNLEEVKKHFSNLVYGLIPYWSGTNTRPGNPPQLVQHPAPPQFGVQMMEEMRRDMREQVHRSELNFGKPTSHVPDATNQSLLNEADQVLGQRASDDVERDERFLTMLTGTAIKLLQKESPGLLGRMEQAGFDGEEMLLLQGMNPVRPECTIKVRESTARYRSYQAKRADIDGALENDALDGHSWRRAMVQFDTPLTPDDKQYHGAAERAAMRVVEGEEWEPLPIGARGQDFIDAFSAAIVDKRVMDDPQAKARLAQAITRQRQLMLAELAPAGQDSGAQGQPAQVPTEADMALENVMAALNQQPAAA
jgi:hypothetical protein